LYQKRTIRKLTFGANPLKEGLAFVVGQSAVGHESGFSISTLSESDVDVFEGGLKRYDLYIIGADFEEVLWKSFVGVPVAIEYFLPDEKE
jgi:hypothetical protein